MTSYRIVMKLGVNPLIQNDICFMYTEDFKLVTKIKLNCKHQPNQNFNPVCWSENLNLDIYNICDSQMTMRINKKNSPSQ